MTVVTDVEANEIPDIHTIDIFPIMLKERETCRRIMDRRIRMESSL